MTDESKERDQLSRLADAMVEDILETSDAEILQDFAAARGEDPAAYAAQMQARFRKTLFAANKSRMAAAKAGVAAGRTTARATNVIDMTMARQTLRRVLASPAAQQLTLAARNESELSDMDVLGMLEDMQELGLWTPETDDGKPR